MWLKPHFVGRPIPAALGVTGREAEVLALVTRGLGAEVAAPVSVLWTLWALAMGGVTGMFSYDDDDITVESQVGPFSGSTEHEADPALIPAFGFTAHKPGSKIAFGVGFLGLAALGSFVPGAGLWAAGRRRWGVGPAS